MRWVLAMLLLAAAMRFPRLAERPMHADEAIQADRLGTLLATHVFHYDPSDYHGPVLAYASLPAAWLARQRSYAELTESLIRSVPVLFGIALVLFSYLIGARAGRPAGVLAALFTAVSPAMVFYSRYYIPEMLLVCFSAGAIWWALESAHKPRLLAAVAMGIVAAAMCATKETGVLALAAAAAAFAVLRRPVSAKYVLAILAAAALVLAVVVSPADCFRAWSGYATRAFSAGKHAHPWHYYFQVLFASGDAAFLAVGLVALPLALHRDRLTAFLGTYSAVLTILYSVLPYKTPWCAAGFLHGWILLAAVGTARLVERYPRAARTGIAGLSIALAAQSWRLVSPLASDPRNPFVYAHSTRDVFTIRDRVERIARRHAAGYAMPVQIVTTENLWPLPWYLRRFSNVQWWREPPAGVPPAPVVLLSPPLEQEVARVLYESRPAGDRELYVNLFDRPMFVRPGVELRGYAALSAY